MEKIKQNAFVKKVGFNRIILVLVMLVMYLSFGLLTGGKFFGMSRIMDTMNYVYFLGFLSLGVTFVIATGGIDFSIGPVMFCCALVSGYSFLTHGIPMAAALILSVVIGFLFGIFNGYLVAYWKIPPFIVSMASMNIAKGIAAVFTKTQSVSWPQSSDANGWYRNFVKAGNVPTGLVIFLAAAIVCGVVLNKTKAGRYILCLGSNKEAVRLSGVDVKKWEMLAYVICNGWYIHGGWFGIYWRYCNWCTYHLSVTAGYSCSWILKRLSVHYYRNYCYCSCLCRRICKT